MNVWLLALVALAMQGGSGQVAAAPEGEMLGRWDMSYPIPSPGDADIAFQGNFEGRWQLYALAADGRLRRLHQSAADDTHPAYSPDGKHLAFISNRDGNDEVYLLDLASGEAKAIAPHPGKDGHPKWSADGAWIVFNRTFDPADKTGDMDSALLRVRPDGTGLEVISDSPRVETFASLSPDGRSVALVEWYPNSAGEPNRNGEIVVLDIATRERRNLTRSDEFDGFPYWGASGRWIYFSSAQPGPAGREFQVFRISPDGSRREALAKLDGIGEVRAVPSADERYLYFNRSTSGRTTIHRMPLPQ